MTGATIGITLAVFVVSVLVARWFNGKLDELEGMTKSLQNFQNFQQEIHMMKRTSKFKQ